MRFIHLSDLHIGKRVNGYSMLEDQDYILRKILNIIDEEKPDAIIIAGDVYDKSSPSDEAVRLFDDFLVRLSKRGKPVFVISGNHDSAVKLAFASKLIEYSGVHMSPVYDGNVNKVALKDEFGDVNIYMLPFVKPIHVRSVFPDKEIHDYTDACRVAVEHMDVDTTKRNIIVAHQFVVGAGRCDSEEVSVGGLDSVDGSVFDDFDYVALGHIHGPQCVERPEVRYCGTPLKYSMSEENHHKSVTVVDIAEKGNVSVREVELAPLRDMRTIKGSYEEVTRKSFYEGTNTEDYLSVILTDEEEITDAINKLKIIYPYIMHLEYDNMRTRENRDVTEAVDVDTKTPLELFEELFEKQNNQPMNEIQKKYMSDLFEKVMEESV
ncbi:MAG: exonuclease SbcCD subunit D [Lachnospiraceae bacterium]|nr:exonuclease SbcCD subunit D [Lachnospiraceae bacterium]